MTFFTTKSIAGIARIVLIALLFGGVFSGCASVPMRGVQGSVLAPVPGWKQTGQASWYGPGFSGKTTASGERFNPNDWTAAHPDLSFGSMVEVRNLKNNRVVRVKINDRGPFIKGRIIDLSERAAKELGMIEAGLARVELRLLR